MDSSHWWLFPFHNIFLPLEVSCLLFYSHVPLLFGLGSLLYPPLFSYCISLFLSLIVSFLLFFCHVPFSYLNLGVSYFLRCFLFLFAPLISCCVYLFLPLIVSCLLFCCHVPFLLFEPGILYVLLCFPVLFIFFYPLLSLVYSSVAIFLSLVGLCSLLFPPLFSYHVFYSFLLLMLVNLSFSDAWSILFPLLFKFLCVIFWFHVALSFSTSSWGLFSCSFGMLLSFSAPSSQFSLTWVSFDYVLLVKVFSNWQHWFLFIFLITSFREYCW